MISHKISIITATYNVGCTILDCLTSVSKQSYINYEHLVIDGLSTDLTTTIVGDFFSEKISIYSESDNGVYDAMNKGISLSCGEIIGFLNGDDFYASDSVLYEVNKVFQNPGVDVCYANLNYVDFHDPSHIIRRWRSQNFTIGLFSKGWCPAHPTFFIRRSALNKIGNYDLSFKMGNDVEFMLRALEVYKLNSVFIPKVWVNMRLGGISNHSLKNIFIQNFSILKALSLHEIDFSFIKFISLKLFSRLSQRM